MISASSASFAGPTLPNVCNVTTLATFLSMLNVSTRNSDVISSPSDQIRLADSTDHNCDVIVIGDVDGGPSASIGPARIEKKSEPTHPDSRGKISLALSYLKEWYSILSGNKLSTPRDVVSLNDDFKIVMGSAIVLKIITI
ncbi:uncharacterized protein LOC107220174 [Neodiprion lecontei]|uniref:Uncharacterized protein LOC107220174 n=1 Tax=Neodiprion lecontei TaxID=441921 RepID=A0A6J0BI24_NEOLC|nr:uncharacterized protein LOC107220174 [Neodiprion lecontei]XP_046600818.1 uncharacterized protein LOC107220174 [Neodiprion lecontei]XP_046600819.1 uncharacterized protein LOC107220174 [Neodiprion lecontei]XP_046600820.1 uncharacterized protein LOC107220174 [Neodiprion lecontei]XP_046600821.1 uncharacterized protein LOC107220174 [Neodiprion lecontei]